MAAPHFIRDPAERFWSKLQKAEGCWSWTGYRNKLGYGTVKFRGRMELAHRVAWLLTNGPIPDMFCVLHRCDNPPCCKPSHLFLGTKQDNVDDMLAKGRANYLSGDECYQRQHPERNRRGEQLAWTKITADDVRRIRAAYANGATRMDLARRYGMGWTTINHIVQRRTWKHVV